MGLPEIFISFETAAVTAITRSARGVLALVLSDSTGGGEAEAVYRSLAEVPESAFTAENYRVLKLAFAAGPAKVLVLRTGGEDDSAVFAALDRLKFDWLAAPALESAKVVSYIKAQREKGRGVKAVVAGASAPDCEGIVNLSVSGLTLEDGTMEAKDYAARIAGLLAALPLTRSATYARLAEVVSCDAVEDPDAAIEAGKLILVPGSDGVYRIGRAVNSLTSLTVDKGAPFQKIKIVEGIDLIRSDIASTFEKGYIGKVLNDYDNKLLLVTAINAYLRSLEGEVLDRTASNLCVVSLEGQRQYLESQGIATGDMKDADILRANTGSEVFLEASLTFCDAMEDLSLVISM